MPTGREVVQQHDVKQEEEEEEEEGIDLGLMLAPMTREQLEMLLVRLLVKHPEELDELVQKTSEAVKTDTLLEFSRTLADKQIMKAITALEAYLEQTYDYLSNHDYKNAFSILRAFSDKFVSCLVSDVNVAFVTEVGEKSEQGHAVKIFINNWEDAWEKVAAALKVVKDEDLHELFVLLAEWRTKCDQHAIYGPLLTSALGELKKRIKNHIHFTNDSKHNATTTVRSKQAQPGDFVPIDQADELLGPSSSSSSSSSSSQPPASKKRKHR